MVWSDCGLGPARHQTSTQQSPICAGEGRCGIASARPGRNPQWVQSRAVVLLDIASARNERLDPAAEPQEPGEPPLAVAGIPSCRARSLVRLARVASIVGALSERDAGPPVTRRSCLRPTLTK